ncbi:ABC transporter substrate-binding protein [Marinithermus hydrothermalis]|uniref:ABC-type transporter, periplasmic subunit n=1 Tax=Marinithermus hydrothermalis (strain DSM 14884 / JCM 11576 / T1) TaxID=869210 RepID=F2NRB1_MARHT|nr:ABC transporter substrate-binding protein [Marinithermus hydrothermalis]AEB12960.1 ABC-type transporter, periplasmic subunit [Marinithermus hydrothermalis DSM 14884]
MKRRWWLAAVLALGTWASAQTLRIGLVSDPDVLDPDLGRTFVGRIVFASLCDKLFDITPDLEIVPQLATGYTWSEDGRTLTLTLRQGVTFHDGEPFNAEAVKFNIERSLTLPGSNRRSEIEPIERVEVVDAYTVRIHLKTPFSPLIAQFADRAGMMVSPKAARELGENFGRAPVCSGPFKFVERVAQDRIVLEKFEDYWNKDQIHFDRVVFLPIPDASVRLANLQSGDLDLIERVAPTDLNTVRDDPRLELAAAVGLGYQGLTINLANPEPRDTPLAKDPRVREALELALDREAINQVVFNGEFVPGNQPVPPTSPWYIEELPMPKRDVARARELLKAAGYDRVAFTLMVVNNPQSIQLGQVIQSMAKEAGFDIQLNAVEFATALDLQEAGEYDAFQIGWSGRIDPDGNIFIFHTCDGALNETGYCDPEVDRLLNAARSASSFEERHELYRQAAERYLPDRHIIYLYHPKWFWGYRADLEGFRPFPDGIIRPEGLKLK